MANTPTWVTSRRAFVRASTFVFALLGMALLAVAYFLELPLGILEVTFIIGTPALAGWLGSHAFWIVYLRQLLEQIARDQQVPRS